MRAPDSNAGLAELFLRESVYRLCTESPARIRRCLDLLSEYDVWQRTETTVSIGNLVLHLAGNVDQWVLGGLGGREVSRDRPAEFNEPGPLSKDDLLARLDSVLDEAESVLLGMAEEDLKRRYAIQGFEVDGVGIVVHVVEHFSYHTGQITFMTKSRKNKLTDFYNESQRNLNQP